MTLRVLPDAYYVGAIGVNAVGLPIMPNTTPTLKSAQSQIWRKSEPYFLCRTGAHYKTHLHFDPVMLLGTVTTKWKCEACVLSCPSSPRMVTQRTRAIGSDGRIYLCCNVCGHYQSPSLFHGSSVVNLRSTCRACHTARVADGRCRNKITLCTMCGGESSVAKCLWCVAGAPPVLARNLFKHAGPLENVNAAYYVFGQPTNTNATTVPPLWR